MSELKRSIIILSAVLIYGTAGFTFFEDIPPLTALFWTVMTISTVGYYGDAAPITSGGLIIAATSVITGLGTLLYFVQTVFAGPLMEMKLKEVFGMGVEIKKDITNHTVVCGYGDIGESVAEELNAIKEKFIIVEKNPERIKRIDGMEFKYFGGAMQGDASNEDVLKKLYIEKAKNLILTSKDDANNVFITLTAKSMNRKLRVVTTASEAGAIKKLYSAGADLVISSPEIGGTLLANASIRPSIVQFLQDAMTATEVGEVGVDTAKIPVGSKFVGTTIGTCECKELTGALFVGIGRENNVIPNPPNDFKIAEGDEVILLGRKEEIKRAKELFGK
jgi:voltage-gated potassium channel